MSRPDPIWLTTDKACAHLCFTGKDRLRSLYAFIKAKGIPKHYRGKRTLLLDRHDLDAAVQGRGGYRRRAAMALVQMDNGGKSRFM